MQVNSPLRRCDHHLLTLSGGSHTQMNIWLESKTHTHRRFQGYVDLSWHAPADRRPSDSFLLNPRLSAASHRAPPTSVCCPRRNPLSARPTLADEQLSISEKMSGWQIIRSECQHFMRRWHRHYRPTGVLPVWLQKAQHYNSCTSMISNSSHVMLQLAVRSHTMGNAHFSYCSVKR